MELYKNYEEMHKGSKLIIMIDKEVSDYKSLELILADLAELVKLKIDYIIKLGADENLGIHEDDLIGSNPKKKVIYINKNGLLKQNGERVNSLDVKSKCFNEKINEILSIGENSKLKKFLEDSEKLIKKGSIDRAHILSLKSKYLIYELFSIDGVGTILGQDFGKPELHKAGPQDVGIIHGLIESNIKLGFLKPRSKEYILNNYSNFLIAYVDAIPVGCVEIINIDNDTIELGALSVIENFLSHKIGLQLIKYVEEFAENHSKTLISVTDNPKLETIYIKSGYQEDVNGIYNKRAIESPGKKIFYKK